MDPRVVSLRRFPASIDIYVEAEAVFLSELELYSDTIPFNHALLER